MPLFPLSRLPQLVLQMFRIVAPERAKATDVENFLNAPKPGAHILGQALDFAFRGRMDLNPPVPFHRSPRCRARRTSESRPEQGKQAGRELVALAGSYSVRDISVRNHEQAQRRRVTPHAAVIPVLAAPKPRPYIFDDGCSGFAELPDFDRSGAGSGNWDGRRSGPAGPPEVRFRSSPSPTTASAWSASRQAPGGDQSREHHLRGQAPDRPALDDPMVEKDKRPRPLQDRQGRQRRRLGRGATARTTRPRDLAPSSCRR